MSRKIFLSCKRLLGLALFAGLAPVAYAQESTEATMPAQDDAAVTAQLDESAESSTAVTPQSGAAPEKIETIAVVPVTQQEAPKLESPHSQAPTQLDEIVVTATKRSQSIRDIPATVNAITGEKLESQGARELQDFVDQVPGLQIQDMSVTSTRKIVIRGIAPDATTNQTVGTLFGDVPLGDPIGSMTVIDPDPWDLETVEVLKGPQGTLFGASSLAGVIRYVPKAPQLFTWETKVFGEWMTVKEGGSAPTFGAAVNVPAGEHLAFRLSGVAERRPGVIDFDNPSYQNTDADDSRKWTGRAMALWEPSENLSINALYMAQERRGNESFFVTNFDADYTRYDAPSSSANEKSFEIASIDARYRFDWATLVSLTAYQTKETHFNNDIAYVLAAQLGEAGIEAGRTRRDVEARGIMQEFRLVSPDEGPWTWQGGVFYSDFSADMRSDIFLTNLNLALPLLALVPQNLRDAFVTENGISIGNVNLSPSEAQELALFGEVARELGSLKITLGGRLYKTGVNGVNRTYGIAPFLTTGSSESVTALDMDDQGFSPKLALAWQATDDVLLYGGVSRGFQYGGVNIVAIPNPNSSAPATYKSSVLWSYEAGIRTDWLDRTLRADLTAYYQQWSDAQVFQTTPPAEGFIDNVGDVDVKGVEMSFRYLLPIEGLSFETNGSLLSSKTAAPFTDSEGDEIPVGTEMANSPHLQATATLNYARVFGQAWETNTALLFTHTDRAWGNLSHSGVLDERNMLNFNFKVTKSDLSYTPSLSLVVNNITDVRKVISAEEGRATEMDPTRVLENFAIGYTRPRSIVLRLGAEFK